MDETEVTVSAYTACPAATCTAPARSTSCNWMMSGRTEHPLNCVDWNQARAYCRWRGGDLPTEAQWEFAARGTDGRIYPWGNDVPGSRLCWNRASSPGYTCAVRSYPSGNSWLGLFDMAGGVEEWVLDYDGSYTGDSGSYVLNPTGPATGSSRVFRGGSWFSSASIDVRASSRNGYPATSRSYIVGFRCARTPL